MKKILLILLFSIPYNYCYAEKYEKTYCSFATNHKSMDILKAKLLSEVKTLLANEFFGELIYSSKTVKNSVLTDELVSSITSGLIRLDGSPRFYNGTNFAEACVKASGYITQEDLKKSQPIKLTKKQCLTDQSLTAKNLKEEAKKRAILNSLYEYNPNLKDRNESEILKLPRKIYFTESGFIPETETYCTKFSGEVIPIEISAFLLKNIKVKTEKKGKTNKSEKKILGKWFGQVTQDGRAYYDVTMTITQLNKGKYSGTTVYSRGINCSGLNTFERKESKVYIFKEIINKGRGCVTQGRIEVFMKENKLRWEWYNIGARGVSKTHALLESVEE